MVQASPFPWNTDPRLIGPIENWNSFVARIGSGERIGLVYHGDIDGVIGAAYVRRAILNHSNATVEPLWIRTDEYDFSALRQWLEIGQFGKCVIVDISLASHMLTVRSLIEHVRDQVFIYDHHLLPEPPPPNDKLVLANPTPTALGVDDNPLPTFAFAFRIAETSGLRFPEWLLLMAIFGEGVDSFAQADASRMLKEHFRLRSIDNLRQAYRRTSLPRVLGYVRAEFATEPKGFVTLDALDDVSLGHLSSFSDFADRLSAKFAHVASEIARTISDTVEKWKERIATTADMGSIVTIRVNSADVAGPVASILRGYFPEKVIVTRTALGKNVTFELRTANDSRLNLPAVLKRVATRVDVVNCGGHPSAAGALVSASSADAFEGELERELTAELGGARSRP